jgi:signal transduction histidine kinase
MTSQPPGVPPRLHRSWRCDRKQAACPDPGALLWFSPNDVPVRVHAALSDAVGEPDHVTSGAISNGTTISSVRLQVIDHGPGIPPAQWGKMFVPFQRLGDHDATASLGLGLAIAQGFTEAMHAELTPSATPGGGLTMTITLPVAP